MLENAPRTIEFDKLPNGGTAKLKTAKFDLYYAKEDDSAKYPSPAKRYVVDEEKGKVNTTPIVYDEEKGKYVVEIPSPQTSQPTIFLLFETEVPEGYTDPILPWGICVDADGYLMNESSYMVNNGISTANIWVTDSDHLSEQMDNQKNLPTISKYLECLEIDPINKYEIGNAPEKTSVTAHKDWNGNSHSDIDSVTFRLYSDKSGTLDEIDNDIASNANDWTVTFDNLDKYVYKADGTVEREINYHIIEDDVEGFVATYATVNGVIVVTNHKVEGPKVKLTIDKKWLIDNTDYSSLKQDVTIYIYNDYDVANTQGSEPVKMVTIKADDYDSSANTWMKTVTGLPGYNGDRALKYWIKEKHMDGFVSAAVSDYQAAVTTTSDAETNAVYEGITRRNNSLPEWQKIGQFVHEIHKPDGTTEVAYCMSHYKDYPKLKDSEEKTSYYRRIKITRDNASQLANYISKHNPKPKTDPNHWSMSYLETAVNDSNKYKKMYDYLIKAAYYGYGTDAASIGQGGDFQGTYTYTDGNYTEVVDKSLRYAHLTQLAVYEYTDYYKDKSYDGFRYNYTKKTAVENILQGRRTVGKSGPFWLIWPQEYIDESHYHVYKNPNEGNGGVDLANEYLKLLGSMESDTLDIDGLGLELYIYKPINEDGTDNNDLQCLLGVETAEINMYASVENEFNLEEIELYKYGAKTLDQQDTSNALGGVEFALYEETTADDENKLPDNQVPAGIDKPVKIKKAKITTGSGSKAGKVTVDELLEGKTYYLVETKTQSNYIKLSKPIAFKLSSIDTNAKDNFTWTENIEDGVIVLKCDADIETVTTLKVANQEVYELPNSGGMGTYWFMVIGAMMMGFAATTLVIRRKVTGKL